MGSGGGLKVPPSKFSLRQYNIFSIFGTILRKMAKYWWFFEIFPEILKLILGIPKIFACHWKKLRFFWPLPLKFFQNRTTFNFQPGSWMDQNNDIIYERSWTSVTRQITDYRVIQLYLSFLDLYSAHLLFDELGQTVEISLAAILDAGIGSGLEELKGGVPGNILSWNEALSCSWNKENKILPVFLLV